MSSLTKISTAALTGPTYRVGVGTTAEGGAILKRNLGLEATKIGSLTPQDAQAATRQTERMELQAKLAQHLLSELGKQKELKATLEKARKTAIESGLASEAEVNAIISSLMQSIEGHKQGQHTLASQAAANIGMAREEGGLARAGIKEEMQRRVAVLRAQHGLEQGAKNAATAKSLDERVTMAYARNEGVSPKLRGLMGRGIGQRQFGLAGLRK